MSGWSGCQIWKKSCPPSQGVTRQMEPWPVVCCMLFHLIVWSSFEIGHSQCVRDIEVCARLRVSNMYDWWCHWACCTESAECIVTLLTRIAQLGWKLPLIDLAILRVAMAIHPNSKQSATKIQHAVLLQSLHLPPSKWCACENCSKFCKRVTAPIGHCPALIYLSHLVFGVWTSNFHRTTAHCRMCNSTILLLLQSFQYCI